MRFDMKSALQKLMSLVVCGLTFGFTAVAHAEVQGEANWFTMPRDASAEGHRIDWLINITNVFITILFIIMVIWMVWAVFAHNERHEADYDHGDSRHHVTVALAISAVIFTIVDGNLFYHAVKDLTEVFWAYEELEKRPDLVRIEVNARQWIWQARYPGPDGEFNTEDDPITVNDIRIPVGRPVIMQLGSPDVIHNLYLPNFRAKMDAIPGTVNQMTFEAKETGEYDLACAQHCGANHYKMKGKLTVLSDADYTSWLAQLSTDSKQVYDEKDTEANWGWSWKKI